MSINMEPVDIIINNFRRLHYLDALVKIIKERTTYPYRIIVVDNLSIPSTRNFIENLKKEGLINEAVYNDKNYTLPQSFSRGFEKVKSEYCVLALDDSLPPLLSPCWLTQLVYLIKNNSNFGAIALNYIYAKFDDYFKEKHEILNIPLNKNNIAKKHAIEEFFQIQKTDDLKTLGFLKRNTGIYRFAEKVKSKLGKDVGVTSRSSGLYAIAWRDKNNGYKESYPEINKFYYD